MTSERRQEIEALFEEALEQPPDERDEWLAARTASDDALGAEVRALLRAHNRAGGILEADAAKAARRLVGDHMRDRHIGPYRVVRELGRGGMGVVYLAERDDGQFRRRVAIKLLRNSPDAEELHHRFLAERQILGALDHPNIAQLIDAGVTEGQLPYLIVEYVDGVPLTEFCDRHQLGIEPRLRLFQSVCAAVHHAHRNLVIHRDLKPSNILVTNDGTVKLLDFGIAKLLNPSLGAMSMPVTRTEQRVMTPEYASPEQVRGESLTTASDVYALGVVLYELLSGRRPYRITNGSLEELTQLVCDREPERPSSRAVRAEVDAQETRVPGGDVNRTITPENVAAARGVSVERLQRQLRGDLDAITMMALRKEANRRYGSAEALSKDVQHYLDGLPILAQKGTRRYRLRKLVRRHRAEVAAVALGVLALAAGAGVAGWQASVAAHERDRAREALGESQEVTDFLLGLFEASDPAEAAGIEITTRELLRRGALRASELSTRPIVQARMLGVLGRVHHSLGDFAAAERLSEDALALQVKQRGETHPDVIAAIAQLATVAQRRGHFDSAQVLLERSLAAQRRATTSPDSGVAHTLDALSALAVQRGDLILAERHSRDALDIRRRLFGADHPLTLGSHARLSHVLRQRGDFAHAEAALREALRLRRTNRYGATSAAAADLVELAALLQFDPARAAEVEALYQQALVVQRGVTNPDHNVTVSALNGLARLMEGRGDAGGAEARLREAVAVRARVYGTDHPRTSAARLHLASMLRRAGRFDEAESEYRGVIEVDRRVLGPTHPNVAGTLTALGVALAERGRLAEADSLLAEAIAIRVARLGPDHFLVARSLRRQAEVRIRQGAFAAADSLLRRALGIVSAQIEPGSEIVREMHASMAGLYEAWGRPALAARHRQLAAPPADTAARTLAVPARVD